MVVECACSVPHRAVALGGALLTYTLLMDALQQFATSLTDAERIGLIFVSLLLCICLEFYRPLFQFNRPRARHIGFNLIFVITSGIVTLGLAYLAFKVLHIDHWSWGLLPKLGLPEWASFLISLALLDLFGQYGIHAALHRYKWLWKLHLVHHSDTEVDASTGTRHHPGDIMVRELLVMAVIAIFGIAPYVYVIYRLITPVFAYMTHANVRMPESLDRALSWIIVTPTMHKFHHHDVRPWTNCNYGNILSIWDRLFGTFSYGDASSVVYGLDTTDAKQDMALAYQLTLPFNGAIKTDY